MADLDRLGQLLRRFRYGAWAHLPSVTGWRVELAGPDRVALHLPSGMGGPRFFQLCQGRQLDKDAPRRLAFKTAGVFSFTEGEQTCA